MGDFTGFTYGGVHSYDDLGILRVSGGDRYDERLHPEVKDMTAEVPGVDGVYYFGSNYGVKNIDVKIAFDHVTEEQIRKMRRVFGDKKLKSLIFDEHPYKKYLAKIESPVELSYVCFDEYTRSLDENTNGVRIIGRNVEVNDSYSVSNNDLIVTVDFDRFGDIFKKNGSFTFEYHHDTIDLGNGVETVQYWSFENESSPIDITYYGLEVSGNPVHGDTITVTLSRNTLVEREIVTPFKYDYSNTERIYKGDGSISFTCPYPFAKSVFKFLSDDQKELEWAISSGILPENEYKNIFDKYDSSTGKIKLYNCGNLETDCRLYLPEEVVEAGATIEYKENEFSLPVDLILEPMNMKINDKTQQTYDSGVLIDTGNNLIIGVSDTIRDITGEIVQYTTSNNIYNEYISAGSFFHILPCSRSDNSTISITNGTDDIEIFYDYLYF